MKREKTRGDSNTRIEDSRSVEIDTELIELNDGRDSLVSVGAARMAGERIIVGDACCRLINPGSGLTAGSVFIHEITPSEVELKPFSGAVRREFLDDFIAEPT